MNNRKNILIYAEAPIPLRATVLNTTRQATGEDYDVGTNSWSLMKGELKAMGACLVGTLVLGFMAGVATGLIKLF